MDSTKMKTNPPAETVVDLNKELELESPDYSPSELSGEISTGTTTNSKEPSTLDESVWETLKRDLTAVCWKFLHVLYPRKSQTLLRECKFDYQVIHSGSSLRGPQFSEVFVIAWFGACVVTLNIKLLGGTISFFQSLCVLGYCLLAPAVSLIICKVIVTLSEQTVILFVIRLLVTVFGFCWATYASTAFLSGSQPPRRKALAVYPIFLFYFVVSWLIVSQTHYGH